MQASPNRTFPCQPNNTWLNGWYRLCLHAKQPSNIRVCAYFLFLGERDEKPTRVITVACILSTVFGLNDQNCVERDILRKIIDSLKNSQKPLFHFCIFDLMLIQECHKKIAMCFENRKKPLRDRLHLLLLGQIGMVTN